MKYHTCMFGKHKGDENEGKWREAPKILLILHFKSLKMKKKKEKMMDFQQKKEMKSYKKKEKD